MKELVAEKKDLVKKLEIAYNNITSLTEGKNQCRDKVANLTASMASTSKNLTFTIDELNNVRRSKWSSTAAEEEIKVRILIEKRGFLIHFLLQSLNSTMMWQTERISNLTDTIKEINGTLNTCKTEIKEQQQVIFYHNHV